MKNRKEASFQTVLDTCLEIGKAAVELTKDIDEITTTLSEEIIKDKIRK